MSDSTADVIAQTESLTSRRTRPRRGRDVVGAESIGRVHAQQSLHDVERGMRQDASRLNDARSMIHRS